MESLRTPALSVIACYQESRGLVPADHPSFAGAVRAAVMSSADVVISLFG
jgi:hypothetical protein